MVTATAWIRCEEPAIAWISVVLVSLGHGRDFSSPRPTSSRVSLMATRANYRLASVAVRPVGQGVSGTLHVTMAAFAKPNGPNAPYCVPNEIICAGLAKLIFLPVPPSGTAAHPATKEPMFVSLDFNLTGSALPPIDPIDAVAKLPKLCAGLVLFDAWVANCDRHRGNVSVDTSSSPPQMSVFDHSHALFGYTPGGGVARLTELRDRLGLTGGSKTKGNRHCLLDALASDAHFLHWLTRIKEVPRFQIEEVCATATDGGATPDELAAAVDFLVHRRDTLSGIVNAHQAEFKGVKQWSLPA